MGKYRLRPRTRAVTQIGEEMKTALNRAEERRRAGATGGV